MVRLYHSEYWFSYIVGNNGNRYTEEKAILGRRNIVLQKDAQNNMDWTYGQLRNFREPILNL